MQPLSNSGVVDCWRVAGTALAALETLKNEEKSINDIGKRRQKSTYTVRAARPLLMVTEL